MNIAATAKYVIVLSVVSAYFVVPSITHADRPNVILILTDDQGYGDVGSNGNPVLQTPNVDLLASQSVRFTDFHVAPMCSPTRGQLMTGIDAMRNGCTAVCQGRSMMRAELPTMANFFADSGYATGHFGKWHLGDSYPHRPQDRGFQETLHHRAWGITSLADYWGNTYFDPVLEHNGTDQKYNGYCTDIFFSEAMEWIDKQGNNDKLFFCYLPRKAAQKNKPLELYHIGRDPGQTKNVAKQNSDIVAAMTQHYEAWHAEARQLFDRERWITLGSEQAGEVTLYAQDWVGDYCDNSKGLAESTARGSWNVDVAQEGMYEIQLRRWPKESDKTLTEGWDGPNDKGSSARPISAAKIGVAGQDLSIDTKSTDNQVAFSVRLPAGKTQLTTAFLDEDAKPLCSAIYTYVRLVDENSTAKRTQPTESEASNDQARIDQPNIVLFFIDDLGYGDIGPFGNTVNRTPSLDRMAKEGNVLRQFYVANTACTPSRTALMTGTYAHRIGMDGDVLFPAETRGLNPEETTIAEMLKTKGYVTGCFGKWHLGDQPQFMPLAQGFDQYFGIPYSNDMWPGNAKGHRHTKQPYTPLPVLLQDEVVSYVSDGADQSLLCEVVTDHTVKFIEEHKDEPFFCYVPHTYVHHPRYARPDILKKAGDDIDRTNVEEVDTSVGRVLDKLRELKLDKKTLVIFTSDNGGDTGMSMGPLRGKKSGPKYEGHMREPTIAWWPGTIPAGVETNEIGVTTDVLPSLAKLVGTDVPTDKKIDGKDILDVLLGKPDAKSPHHVHYYEIDAVRRGPWKLIRIGKRIELYNLDDDLGETKNLAQRRPDIVAQLEKLLDAHAAQIAADTRPAGFEPEGTAKPLLSEAGDLPKLREFMGLPETTSRGPSNQKAAGKTRRPR